MVSRKYLPCILIGALLLVADDQAVAHHAKVAAVTTCQVLAETTKFEGKTVRLAAVFQGQQMERQYILDESCLALGRIAVSPDDDKNAKIGHVNMLGRAIERARVASNMKTPSTVKATVVGTIRMRTGGAGGVEIAIKDAVAIEVVERPPVQYPIPAKNTG